MKFIDGIKNNSILIIPNNIKNKVLEYIDKNNILKSIKIMNFIDLKKGLFFDYNNKTIDYVMNKYNVNYNIALNYINDLYYVDDIVSDNNKILFLKKLKEDLLNNNLLIIDKLFSNLLKSKDAIYVYGFDYINKFNEYMLKKIDNVIIINKNNNNFKHEVYEFNDIKEEICYVAENIANLISQGTPFNKIYIANYSEEYFFTLRTIFKSFNIPYYVNSNNNLYNTSIGKYFLNNLNNNINSLLNTIKIQYDIENNAVNRVCFNKLFNLLNSYYWCNNIEDKKELLIAEMKKTIIPNNHHEKEITVTNILDNVFQEDEYVFLIGFNLGSIPILKKDEDYINDDIKPYYLETSSEYNKIIKETYLQVFKNIKNLIITSKNNSNFSSHKRSFLIDDDYLKISKKEYTISNFSDDINKLNLALKIDDLIKFNETNETLEILNNNYESLYNTYSNEFTKINENKIINKINNKISFSATSIKTYYECPFKYYLNNILKINTYETTLSQFIGDIYHYVLENCLDKDDESIDECYEKYLNDNKEKIEDSYKNKFFIEHLKKEIHFIIKTIKKQYSHSKHTLEKHEITLELPINRKINTKIVGIIDKLLLLDNNALIIDYKTSNTEFEKNLIEYGVEIQLPIYLYLLKNLKNDINIAGIYLQHILNLKSNYEPNKDLIIEKEKKLKLDGITFNNINLISNFDDSYEKSEVIKGLSLKKDGTIKNTKNIFDNEDEILNIAKTLIINAIDAVCESNFKIHPLKIEKKKDGCEYCDYKDICFVKNKDFNYQTLSKGDDDNE